MSWQALLDRLSNVLDFIRGIAGLSNGSSAPTAPATPIKTVTPQDLHWDEEPTQPTDEKKVN